MSAIKAISEHYSKRCSGRFLDAAGLLKRVLACVVSERQSLKVKRDVAHSETLANRTRPWTCKPEASTQATLDMRPQTAKVLTWKQASPRWVTDWIMMQFGRLSCCLSLDFWQANFLVHSYPGAAWNKCVCVCVCVSDYGTWANVSNTQYMYNLHSSSNHGSSLNVVEPLVVSNLYWIVELLTWLRDAIGFQCREMIQYS